VKTEIRRKFIEQNIVDTRDAGDNTASLVSTTSDRLMSITSVDNAHSPVELLSSLDLMEASVERDSSPSRQRQSAANYDYNNSVDFIKKFTASSAVLNSFANLRTSKANQITGLRQVLGSDELQKRFTVEELAAIENKYKALVMDLAQSL
jgi:adhesin HecA-like repeat protein